MAGAATPSHFQGMMKQPPQCCEMEGREIKPPGHLAQGTHSPPAITDFVPHERKTAYLETGGEKSGASVSSRESSLLNLDLSLLPCRESVGLVFDSPAHQLPPQSPFHWRGASPNAYYRDPSTENAQLTIFYGGMVNVYDVSADTAKVIMAIANSKSVPISTSTSTSTQTQMHPTSISSPGHLGHPYPVFTLNTANLPITRKKSLQRFLEKRNNRLHGKAPYAPLH